jgi:hypothetical protein
VFVSEPSAFHSEGFEINRLRSPEIVFLIPPIWEGKTIKVGQVFQSMVEGIIIYIGHGIHLGRSIRGHFLKRNQKRMPYKIQRNKDGSYAVENTATGQKAAKHTTKGKAEAQVRLLEMIKGKKKNMK